MSSFKEIKKDDIVLVPVKVSFRFYEETFFLEKKVTRVTKTQFVCGDIRASKKDGSIIGRNYEFIRAVGEVVYNGKVLSDESKELLIFKEKMRLAHNILNFEIKENGFKLIKLRLEQLSELYKLIKSIDKFCKDLVDAKTDEIDS